MKLKEYAKKIQEERDTHKEDRDFNDFLVANFNTSDEPGYNTLNFNYKGCSYRIQYGKYLLSLRKLSPTVTNKLLYKMSKEESIPDLALHREIREALLNMSDEIEVL
jgi:hypothetical protein